MRTVGPDFLDDGYHRSSNAVKEPPRVVPRLYPAKLHRRLTRPPMLGGLRSGQANHAISTLRRKTDALPPHHSARMTLGGTTGSVGPWPALLVPPRLRSRAKRCSRSCPGRRRTIVSIRRPSASRWACGSETSSGSIPVPWVRSRTGWDWTAHASRNLSRGRAGRPEPCASASCSGERTCRPPPCAILQCAAVRSAYGRTQKPRTARRWRPWPCAATGCCGRSWSASGMKRPSPSFGV